jgi:small subunit ribosomal protein S1
MDFKVIEFNRDAKRILLSHLRTWEERKEAPAKEVKVKKEKEAQPELPKMEKTTLGDLSVLADLKASMAADKK